MRKCISIILTATLLLSTILSIPVSNCMFDITTEIFYDNEWNNISADVRNTHPVTVKRGIQNEGSRKTLSPDSSTLVLNNGKSKVNTAITGRYSPKNPNSDLFGKIGRNTPIRQYTGTKHVAEGNTELADSTSQVAPSVDAPSSNGLLISAWAAPDPTGTYILPGSMTAGGSTTDSNMSFDSGYEVISSSGSTGTRTATFSVAEDYVSASAFLNGSIALTDVDFSTGFSTLIFPTVNDVTSSWWVVISSFVWGEGTELDSGREDEFPAPHFPNDTDGGGWILLGQSDVAEPGDAEAQYFQIKIWAKKIKTADFHTIKIENPGNKLTSIQSVLLQVHNVDPWSIRFNHEINQLSPKWGLAGKNESLMYVSASGITDRLGRPNNRPNNAIHRLVENNIDRVAGYWPLDDPKESTGARAIVGNSMKLVPTDFPTQPKKELPKYQEGSLFPWVPNGILTSVGGTFLTNTPGMSEGGFTVDFIYKAGTTGSDDETSGMAFAGFTQSGDDFVEFRLAIGYGAIGVIVLDNNQSVLDFVQGNPDDSNVLDGHPHHIRYIVSQGTGTTADIEIYLDGVLVVSDSMSIGISTVPPLNYVKLSWNNAPNATPPEVVPVSLGQFILWTDDPVDLDESVAAYYGYQNETPIERFRRICREDSVVYSYSGDPSNEETLLGPQYPGSIIDILSDVAATGNGLLHEAREFAGWTYNSIDSLYNNDSRLELDYSANHISDPFDPTTDNQNTLNDISARSRSGGFARLVKNSGSLNVNDPQDDPEGVGLFPGILSPDPNLSGHDRLLVNQVGWALLLGTQDEYRFPEIKLDLKSLETRVNDLSSEVLLLDIADRFTIDNPPSFSMPPEQINQILLGYTEKYSIERWEIKLHGAPYQPYQISELEHDEFQVIGAFNTTTVSSFDAGTDTTLTVTGDDWTHESDFDILVGGVRLTVTGASANGSNYDLTVTQTPVNGIDITIPAGTKVEIFPRHYIGL